MQNEKWCDFLDTYKNLPELWDVDHPNYKNKKSRQKAYDKLLVKIRRIECDVTIDGLKRKLANMRTCYRRELKKKIQSERNAVCEDDIYVPSLWYFDRLEFLKDIKILGRMKDLDFTDDFEGELEEDQKFVIKKSITPQQKMSTYSRSSKVTDGEEEEKFLITKKSNPTPKHKMSVLSRSPNEEDVAEEEKFIIATKSSPKYKKRKFVDTSMDFVKSDLEPIENEEPKRKRDEAAVYAEGWAYMFRQMTPEQQLYAKQAVDEIMLLGRCNHLYLNYLYQASSSNARGHSPLEISSPPHCSNSLRVIDPLNSVTEEDSCDYEHSLD